MSVNYLYEINALNDWELCHPLSATAYKVLLKLYHLANKERFPERMTVPNRVLMSMTGCSEDSLIKARNQLIQSGRIEYKGQKKLTPLYMIQYFSMNNPVYNSDFQSIEQRIKQGIEQGIKHGIEQGIEHGTYINKTILKESKENNADIYTQTTNTDADAEANSELNELCEKIADASGHKGNIAYINGIKNNLIRGGDEAIKYAKQELERMKYSGFNKYTANRNYQHHEYTDDDFDESFYYNPFRDFLKKPEDELKVIP